MGPPVEQEEQEADVTVRTRTRTCLRCGETTVELENTRVAIDEVESQASQTQPTANEELDVNDELDVNEPPVQHSQPEPAPEEPSDSVDIPEYSPEDLDEDEIPASGDAIIIDESTEPPAEPAPQQFGGGGEVIEHAFGDTHQQTGEDETEYDHGAFKGDVTEEPDFSPDPGEILDADGEAEAPPEPEEPEARTQNANHVPDDSRLLQCRSCSFSEPHAGSALREGDICGSCGSSYLSLVDPSRE